MNRVTPEFTCEDQSDCDPMGRVCEDGFCIVAECPSACQTCDTVAKLCVVGCDSSDQCNGTIDCPEGFTCSITCSGGSACDSIECDDGAVACDITCSGANSCGTVRCGDGAACTIRCGNGECDAVDCADACSCDLDCGGSCAANIDCPVSDQSIPCDDMISERCDSDLVSASCNRC